MKNKTSFRMVFGDAPVVKIVDFLLDNREFDYSLTDIAKGADVGWSTLHQFWKEFVKLNLVRKTRQIGRATLYKLNTNNPLVEKLTEIDLVISKMMIQKKIKTKKIVA